ncbi:MAG: hypothetical protein ACT4QF_11330 [Sporichthyaceae bacterium]
MDSSDGEWVELEQPDGVLRRLWRPDEQPASPDGTFGTWYVVTLDGVDRLEWFSRGTFAAVPVAPAPTRLAPEPAAEPVERGLFTRRFVVGWTLAATATAALVIGVGGLGGGGSEYVPPTAAELAPEIGVSFGRFAIEDDVFDGRSGGVPVTIVNLGRTTRTFWTTIEAVGPGGVLATETLAVRQLRAGEATTRSAFADVPNLDGLAAATFAVTRTAGTPPPVT